MSDVSTTVALQVPRPSLLRVHPCVELARHVCEGQRAEQRLDAAGGVIQHEANHQFASRTSDANQLPQGNLEIVFQARKDSESQNDMKVRVSERQVPHVTRCEAAG